MTFSNICLQTYITLRYSFERKILLTKDPPFLRKRWQMRRLWMQSSACWKASVEKAPPTLGAPSFKMVQALFFVPKYLLIYSHVDSWVMSPW